MRERPPRTHTHTTFEIFLHDLFALSAKQSRTGITIVRAEPIIFLTYFLVSFPARYLYLGGYGGNNSFQSFVYEVEDTHGGYGGSPQVIVLISEYPSWKRCKWLKYNFQSFCLLEYPYSGNDGNTLFEVLYIKITLVEIVDYHSL